MSAVSLVSAFSLVARTSGGGLNDLWRFFKDSDGRVLLTPRYPEICVRITGCGASFQKWFWLLDCFYSPLVYHQDISPFHGDFLKRSHSHFRKRCSCWMTMIASFSGCNEKQLLSDLSRKRGRGDLAGQGQRESPASCDDIGTVARYLP